MHHRTYEPCDVPKLAESLALSFFIVIDSIQRGHPADSDPRTSANLAILRAFEAGNITPETIEARPDMYFWAMANFLYDAFGACYRSEITTMSEVKRIIEQALIFANVGPGTAKRATSHAFFVLRIGEKVTGYPGKSYSCSKSAAASKSTPDTASQTTSRSAATSTDTATRSLRRSFARRFESPEQSGEW